MNLWGISMLVALALASPATQTAPKYDKSAEVTITGIVTDVKDYECPISGTMGAHITIKPEQGEPIEIHVAATKFVKSYEMVFAKGDTVEVVGSKVKFQGNDVVIARELTHGQDTFTFRDKDGKPVW
jgi:DNA/RNA endonuclease YhcR with UshA esterase domain